jgi:O-acetyl-ADP-ribose deacetylase
MEIVAQQGDITRVHADAVVNPANSRGEMGGGIAGALNRAGGPNIEKEAMTQAPIPVGEAVATAAGTLPFRFIIHAPTMEEPAQPTTVEKIRKATLAAMMCADSYGVRVLAVPGMGTGVGGVALDRAAETIVETLRNYETASVRKVILVDHNADMVSAFREALIAERA